MPFRGRAWRPPNWIVHEDPVDASFLAGEFRLEDDHLVSLNNSHVTRIDPVTLEPLAR